METANEEFIQLDKPLTTNARLLPEGDGLPDDEEILCVRLLKERGLWVHVVRLTKLLVHFLVVMLLLFGGAVFLAEFEDPASSLKGTFRFLFLVSWGLQIRYILHRSRHPACFTFSR